MRELLLRLLRPHQRAVPERIVRVSVVGQFRDVIRHADGRVEDRGWSHNQIQDLHATVLAGLVKRQSAWSGATHLALGTGQPVWDSTPPTQPSTDTSLETEVFRQAIATGEITWRDPTSFADIDPTPSNVIQIDVTIGTGSANGNQLREFGVFGGDASGTSGSGKIMNWVVHGRIDKDATISIDRSIRWTYLVS